MTSLIGILDRVKQTTPSTGTGSLNLTGAAFGNFQTWANGGAVSGFVYPYLIEDGADSEWGFGAVTLAGGTWSISRDTVIGSIIGGTSGTSKINIVSGSATVACAANHLTQPLVSYDATILAESSLTHYWKLNEAAGSTSFADSKGATALTITSDTAGNIAAGWKGTVQDGQSAVLFRGIAAAKTNGIINIPSGVMPASGSWSWEMVLGWEGLFTAVIGVPMCIDTSGTNMSMGYYIRNDQFAVKNCIWFSLAGGVDNWQPDSAVRIGRGTHLVCTVDSVANKTTLYNNGVKVPTQFTGTAYQTAAGGLGTYLPSRDAGVYAYAGKISKFAIYNAALTEAQAQAHADAAGLS